MAGHSKWGNTKHRKTAQDAKRSKIFTKIIREVISAIKLGGSDPRSNSRLRAAIDKALSNNMTRDTLNRTIMRCIGDEKIINIENIIYEGYGPGGVAILIECLTNNRNRTVSEIRNAFNSVGGNLGTNGSVSYLFSRKGVISFKSDQNKDKLLEMVLKIGIEDIIKYDNGMIDVFTLQEKLYSIYDELDKLGFKAHSTKYLMIPSIKNQLNGENTKKLLNLIDLLENSEDVQEVYHNGKFFKQ